MANERVAALRNVGTEESPVWEQYFTETVADAVFMDETKAKNIKGYIDEGLDGKSGTGHKHTKDDITDLPDWVKSGNKPTYTASEVGAAEKNHTHTAEDVGAIPATAKGANGGVAELDSNGKIPSEQLPSYVDDVIEGTLINNTTFNGADGKAVTPEKGKIYLDTTTNKQYRWSGSQYVHISNGGVELGESEHTAFRGDHGKEAYDHSKKTHAPENAERNKIETVKVNGEALTPDAQRAVDISVPTITFGTTPPTKAAPNSLFFQIQS